MCYLCLRENPFDPKPAPTSLDRKKQRLAEIKASLKDDTERCTLGEIVERNLRQEQYDLAKDL